MNNIDKSTRFSNLKAMERLMITLGGKEGLIIWMAAMPDNVTISPVGGVSNESLMAVAEDDKLYKAAMKAFAEYMGPVLKKIASEV